MFRRKEQAARADTTGEANADGEGDLEVGVEEAKRRLEAGDAVLLDVREPDEWREGHVAGATHIPLGALPASLAALPRDRTLLLFCRSGVRSGLAAEALRGAAFGRAVNVAGGILAWTGRGFPVERGA